MDLGNGQIDLITTGTNTGNIYVMLGNGNGTFQAPQAYLAMKPPPGDNVTINAVVATDFGSGLGGPLNLVVTATPRSDPSAGEVILLPGNGDGTFGSAEVLANVASAGDIVAGDFGNGATDLAVAAFGGVTVIYGTPLTITPNTTPQTARSLGDTVHLVTQPEAIVTGDQDAYFTYTVPTEATPGAGAEVVDISALFQDTTGAGLTLSVTLAGGGVPQILQQFADGTTGGRFRVLAPQGAELIIHIAGSDGNFGAYTLDIDVLPQIVSAQAESPLPGGPITSIVLTLQGDRLDPTNAQNPQSYVVYQLGANGAPIGAAIPLADDPNTQSVVYDSGANIDVVTGRTFPTAVRQTITLDFAQPLTAGASYAIFLAGDIGAADLNAGECSGLADVQGMGVHPLVNAAGGVVVAGGKIVVTATQQKATDSQLTTGTPFLTQLHDNLGAQLTSLLNATGDSPTIPVALTNEIIERFVPGWLASGGNTPFLILWLDPVSIQLADPTNARTTFNLQNNAVNNDISRSYIEVGGSVEVIVIAAISGSYNLNVSDVQPSARGEAVLLDAGTVQTVAITDALRSGDTQFQFTFPQDQQEAAASSDLVSNFTSFAITATNFVAFEVANGVLAEPAIAETIVSILFQVQTNVETGGTPTPGGVNSVPTLPDLPPAELLNWLTDRLMDGASILPLYGALRRLLNQGNNNNPPEQNQNPPEQSPPLEEEQVVPMSASPDEEAEPLTQIDAGPEAVLQPTHGNVLAANPLSGLVAASVISVAAAYGYAWEPEEDRNRKGDRRLFVRTCER